MKGHFQNMEKNEGKVSKWKKNERKFSKLKKKSFNSKEIFLVLNSIMFSGAVSFAFSVNHFPSCS